MEGVDCVHCDGRVVRKTERVAVVQAASVVFDCSRTLAKVRKLASDAAANDAGLVLFPEAFISGYPRGMSFGTVIGDRTPEGRDQFRMYWESSVDIPGPVVDELAALAAELNIHMVVGVVERDLGTLYCTALFFSPGSYLGKHRKVMPTAAERVVWGFGEAATLPVFDTPLGRLGAVICWENYMPLLRMVMYSKGVQIYCIPTADGRETWLSTIRPKSRMSWHQSHPMLSALAEAASSDRLAMSSRVPTSRERRSCSPISISLISRARSMTSTSRATMPGRTCSISRSMRRSKARSSPARTQVSRTTSHQDL